LRRLSRRWLHLSILLLIITAAFSLQSVCPVWAGEIEAVSEISRAEDSLKSAYLSVLEAERAGGDISELVAWLNAALEYFSEAERAFGSGEYDSAVLLAGRVVEISDVILDDAVGLRGVAELQGEVAFRNQLLISFGAVCSIVAFGFLGWRRFKDYYLRRVMGLRSEVVVDES
jgi:hypothetical protein